MTSRWPSVVSSATRAPLRSSSALVATVVPWTMRSVRASRSGSARPSRSASTRQAVDHALLWSAGVLRGLGERGRAVGGDADHIGEGAADIDADAVGHRLARRSASAPFGAAIIGRAHSSPSSASRARAAGSRFAGGPQPPPPPERTCSTSPGASAMPISLVCRSRDVPSARSQRVVVRRAVLPAQHAGRAVAHAVAGGVRDRRAVGLQPQLQLAAQARRDRCRRPRCRAGIRAARRTAGSAPPPSRRCRTSARRPNAIRPRVDQPSPFDDPPPPGRAWNRCQTKDRPGRRASLPLIAMRKRRPQPPIARSGQALRQRLHHRLDDLVRAVAGAQRHRRALPRPDDGAFLAR